MQMVPSFSRMLTGQHGQIVRKHVLSDLRLP